MVVAPSLERQTNRWTARQAAPLSRSSKVTASALSSISNSTGQGLLKQLIKLVHAFMKVGILNIVTVSLVHKFTSYLSKSYLHGISQYAKVVCPLTQFFPTYTVHTVLLICPISSV